MFLEIAQVFMDILIKKCYILIGVGKWDDDWKNSHINDRKSYIKK